MNPEAMKPFGMALVDYYNGDSSATLIVNRDDGVEDELPVSVFFRESIDYDTDKTALDKCRGRVLDVGAGTGLHSLYLQNHGLPVCAIDISSEACDIMRHRGVKEVYCTDISGFNTEPFDTILILGRSIGMVENVAGLDCFLTDIHRLLKPDGQILLNSLNVKYTDNTEHLAYHETNRSYGRYIGEIRMYFEYKGLKGKSHGWLHVDEETLANHASKAGWLCETLVQEEDGNYLVKMIRVT